MLLGLKQALAAEVEQKSALESLRSRIEAATQTKASALARRQEVVVSVVSGGRPEEVVKIDEVIRRAESTIAVLTEAGLLAEARLRDAEKATEAILRREVSRRLAIAVEEFRQADAAFVAATDAR